MYTLLNADEHASIFNKIMHMIATQSGGVYFLYGYGCTGKTFVWKTLSSTIHSNSDIVLTVASSGIASILLPGVEQHILEQVGLLQYCYPSILQI